MRLSTQINEIDLGTNILDIEVPEKLRQRAERAMRYCPTRALTITSE